MANENEERGWLLSEVSGAVANALRGGVPDEDIAGAVAVELGDTSKAKVRVADALRREGYLLALEKLQTVSDDPKAPLDDEQRDGVLWALIELQCQAPGEAE